MPSYQHEVLLELFRSRCGSAADLLRQLDVQLPEYDEVRSESSDITDLNPAEYRADLVLILKHGSHSVLGIIVEVQLGRDENKPFTWPAYVANLRNRHRCPVCLLVVTTDDSVARWAGRCIDLGPGWRGTPCVFGPFNTPVITALENAQENVELAVLSATVHGQNPDAALAAQIASVAVKAISNIDAERSKLYLDLIRCSLSPDAQEALENTMNSLGFEYQSDFARRYVAEGRTEGRAEGRVEITLHQLAKRFGPVPDSIQTRVRGASEAQLYAIVDRLLTAQTLGEALGASDSHLKS